jgi:excisionase family DNA binding protein
MEIEARLAAIEETQSQILKLLVKNVSPPTTNLTLREAAEYVGFSTDHFRRLSVEQRMIPFSRPSGQQKGKLLFRKTDLDKFLERSIKEDRIAPPSGRKRKSKNILTW